MKKMMTLILAVLLLFPLTSCSSSSTNGDKAESGAKKDEAAEEKGVEKTEKLTMEEGKLYMTTNAEFAPYEYYEGDKIVGIDIEIAGLIAEKMGLELVVNDIAFDSIVPEIAAGKADIALAGMSVTEDRLKNVDFSIPYTGSKQVIIVKKGSDIKTKEDLKAKIIGVQLGTTGDMLASEVEGVTMERYGKSFEIVQALSQGKIDAIVIDSQPAEFYIKDKPELVILDEPFEDEAYAVAIKKGNTALLNKVNEILDELIKEGKIEGIIKKYEGKE